jgi:hypothetical protein
MINGFTETYRKEITEQILGLEVAITRGVSTWEEYNKLVGKHSGLSAALAYFNDLADVIEKQE